jgi:pyrroline-5-carboxylate reductase
MAPSQFAIQGAGHLAVALVEGFHRAHIGPGSIHNRTHASAAALAERFPSLTVFEQQPEFDSEPCPLLLVIPGPAILHLPAERVERFERSGRVIVSCANGLPLSLLDRTFPELAWVKAIPSVAAAIGHSVTLMAKGAATPESGFAAVERLFISIGTALRIDSDEEIDRLSVLSSSMPGLLAVILDELARTYGLEERQTHELLVESALGSILLARERAAGLTDLVASVANPGGLTEAGVSALRRGLPPPLAGMKQAMDGLTRERRLRYLAT